MPNVLCRISLRCDSQSFTCFGGSQLGHHSAAQQAKTLNLRCQLASVMQELCAECASAKVLFDKAADILGYDLLEVCSEGE